MIEFLLYLLYAYVQGVLFIRYGMRDRTDVVPGVLLSIICAPLITIGLLIALLWITTEYLAKPRP